MCVCVIFCWDNNCWVWLALDGKTRWFWVVSVLVWFTSNYGQWSHIITNNQIVLLKCIVINLSIIQSSCITVVIHEIIFVSNSLFKNISLISSNHIMSLVECIFLKTYCVAHQHLMDAIKNALHHEKKLLAFIRPLSISCVWRQELREIRCFFRCFVHLLLE